MTALQGMRLLDISRTAPWLSMMLADLGMDTIIIEEPGGGRRAQIERKALKLTPEQEERTNAFNAFRRNKKSIALNLKSEQGRNIFYRLCQTADVVTEAYRPGVVKRLGVDYETVSKLNPRIVYCSVTGYGQDGPYSTLVGHDINYAATAGALSLIGGADHPGYPPSNMLADLAGAALHGAIGVLAALVARDRTGKGQFVDVAMMDGVTTLLTTEANAYFATGVVPRPGEGRLTGGLPCYNTYETRDGLYIALGCNEPYFWENLCQALGHEEFAAYQYDTGARRAEIFATFREIFRSKTRDEWFEELSKTDIAVAMVNHLDEAFSNPQMLHRNMVVELEHPRLGKVRQVGIAIKLSDTPGAIRSLPPLPGEHTDELLLGLGYTGNEVKKLRQAGAIG